MRDDLFHLLVERPRLRYPKRALSRYPRGALKTAWRGDLEQAPRHEAMGSATYANKWLNENLAPLVRLLRGRVGHRWNDVHAELSAVISKQTAVQKHVFDHLKHLVCEHAHVAEDGTVWGATRSGLRPLGRFFWVDANGLLREVAWQQRWHRQRAPAVERAGQLVRDGRQLHRLKGCWYEVTLAPLPPYGQRAEDVVLGLTVTGNHSAQLQQRYGAPTLYAERKRPLTRAELRAQGLRNQ
jgi:hypothetical protein